MITPKTLAERLQLARTHAKLTQIELEEVSGVSQQAISRLETGEQKKTTDIVQLAVACKVRSEWLAMAEGDMIERRHIVMDEITLRGAQALQQLPSELRAEQVRGLYSIIEHLPHHGAQKGAANQ